MSFMSVKRENLQRAFSIAHRASENFDTPAIQRALFKQIARELWEAAGEQGTPVDWKVQANRGAGWITTHAGSEVECRDSFTKLSKVLNNGQCRLVNSRNEQVEICTI